MNSPRFTHPINIDKLQRRPTEQAIQRTRCEQKQNTVPQIFKICLETLVYLFVAIARHRDFIDVHSCRFLSDSAKRNYLMRTQKSIRHDVKIRIFQSHNVLIINIFVFVLNGFVWIVYTFYSSSPVRNSRSVIFWSEVNLSLFKIFFCNTEAASRSGGGDGRTSAVLVGTVTLPLPYTCVIGALTRPPTEIELMVLFERSPKKSILIPGNSFSSVLAVMLESAFRPVRYFEILGCGTPDASASARCDPCCWIARCNA